jgi:hypothetical protein
MPSNTNSRGGPPRERARNPLLRFVPVNQVGRKRTKKKESQECDAVDSVGTTMAAPFCDRSYSSQEYAYDHQSDLACATTLSPRNEELNTAPLSLSGWMDGYGVQSNPMNPEPGGQSSRCVRRTALLCSPMLQVTASRVVGPCPEPPGGGRKAKGKNLPARWRGPQPVADSPPSVS